MATTFHLFPLLPRELRDEIWAFALRPHHRESKSFAYTIPPRKLIMNLGEPCEYGDYRDSSIYFVISAKELERFYDVCPWFINDHRHHLGDRIGLHGWEDL
ncbi:hypothetical protein QWA68_010584 [Fusarium oxysporum]|nr:hypothetical protein QWA68_010584 [Fusarium oxysporum]